MSAAMRRGVVLAGRYEIVEAIGVGAMGTVYRARNLHTGGIVALKAIHPLLAHDPTYRARLRREARLAAAITSQRVVRVIDLDDHDDVPFLVMEYVAGQTLADLRAACGRFPLAEALATGAEVARAVEAAYACGIVHRDLKPQNIKLVDGQVKVLDFGIARMTADASVTITGTYVGTPAYSAPERLNGHADIRADIYAIGVVLFELIAGRLPFPASTPLAVQRQHESMPPPPLPGDVPEVVQDLIARCLAKSPANRYQTPSELVHAFDEAIRAVTNRFGDMVATAAHATLTTATDVASAAHAPGTPTMELPSPALTPTNLRDAGSSFIGRAREVADIKRRLVTARLLTLASTGGCGKTRLALRVGADLLTQYRDGVWLVELAALAEPGLVPQTVATALGVQEQAGQSLMEALIAYLEPRHLLLLLDNCEHLSAACADLVETLLESCPGLQILATSREMLGVSGEAIYEEIYQVPSLSLPNLQDPSLAAGERLAALMQSDAVQLFVERARTWQPHFVPAAVDATSLLAVCQRLDGIPLAIELASARMQTVSLDEMAMQLENRVRLLTGIGRRALSREQTLRAVLDWSYQLLTEPEQRRFRRLAVFAGDFGADAAAACAGHGAEPVDPSEFDALLRTGLLVSDVIPSGETRYRMLETLRQYGAEKLQTAGEAAALHARHQQWYLALAERAEPELVKPDQRRWLACLEQEHDNLRVALAWSIADEGEREVALRLASALWRFWYIRGHFAEGRGWLERIIDGSDTHRSLRAKALNGAGVLAFQQGEHDQAQVWFEASLALCRELNDAAGAAVALNSLGNLAWAQGDYKSAKVRHEETLTIRRHLGDANSIAISLNNLGTLASDCGEYEQARLRHEEALALRRALGDTGSIARSLHNLAEVAHRGGDHTTARSLLCECLITVRELGNRASVAGELGALARVAEALGEPEHAVRFFSAAAALRQAINLPLGLTDRDRYEESCAAARARLGDVAFATLWADGQARPLDHVIDEALAWGSFAHTDRS